MSAPIDNLTATVHRVTCRRTSLVYRLKQSVQISCFSAVAKLQLPSCSNALELAGICSFAIPRESIVGDQNESILFPINGYQM